MKQLILISALTVAGCIGTLIHPFYGVLLYYTFALLQPQDFWSWSLPEGVRWSFIAAAAAIFGTLLALPSVIRRTHWNIINTLTVLFGVCIVISALDAMNSDTAAWWGTLMAKVLAMTLVASLTIHQLSHVRWTVWMIFIVLGYLAWEINYAYFFQGGRMDLMRRGHGGLDNNGFGLLVAMGVPFAYAVAQTSPRWIVKAGCALLAVFMMHAVMMSFSRMAMLCALLGAVWLLLHHRPRWQAMGLAGAGVCVVLALAGPEVRDRFESIQTYEQDGSAQSRFDSWAAAWQITWDHPLTGVGVRNSNLLSKNYGADVYGRTIHNQYLQTSADLGVPAAVIYIWICVIALWRTSRVRARCLVHGAGETTGGIAPAEAAPRHHQLGVYALAIQTSMIMFCFGAFFLSLEVFELTWLLVVLAGVLPTVADLELGAAAPAAKPVETTEPLITALPA